MSSVIENQALGLLLSGVEVSDIRHKLKPDFASCVPRREELDVALSDCQQAMKKLRRALRADDSWRDWELREMVHNLDNPHSSPYYEGALICARNAAAKCNKKQAISFKMLIESIRKRDTVEEIFSNSLKCFSVVHHVVGYCGATNVRVGWTQGSVITQPFKSSAEAVKEILIRCNKKHKWDKA